MALLYVYDHGFGNSGVGSSNFGKSVRHGGETQNIKQTKNVFGGIYQQLGLGLLTTDLKQSIQWASRPYISSTAYSLSERQHYVNCLLPAQLICHEVYYIPLIRWLGWGVVSVTYLLSNSKRCILPTRLTFHCIPR